MASTPGWSTPVGLHSQSPVIFAKLPRPVPVWTRKTHGAEHRFNSTDRSPADNSGSLARHVRLELSLKVLEWRQKPWRSAEVSPQRSVKPGGERDSSSAPKACTWAWLISEPESGIPDLTEGAGRPGKGLGGAGKPRSLAETQRTRIGKLPSCQVRGAPTKLMGSSGPVHGLARLGANSPRRHSWPAGSAVLPQARLGPLPFH
jgi:hypothetical protein